MFRLHAFIPLILNITFMEKYKLIENKYQHNPMYAKQVFSCVRIWCNFYVNEHNGSAVVLI